jgi:hypothetical protein
MNFRHTRAQLDALLGPNAAHNLVGNALYVLIVGANDFLDNYLSPIPSTAESSLPPEAFISKLIASFRDQIMVKHPIEIQSTNLNKDILNYPYLA